MVGRVVAQLSKLFFSILTGHYIQNSSADAAGEFCALAISRKKKELTSQVPLSRP